MGDLQASQGLIQDVIGTAGEVDRLHHVGVESRLPRSIAIFLLAPPGQRDDHQVAAPGPRRMRRPAS